MKGLIGRRRLLGAGALPLAAEAMLRVRAEGGDFTPEEMEALVMAARLLARTEGTMGEGAQAALTRLAGKVPTQARQSSGLARDFDVSAGEGREAALAPIAEAIRTGRVLRLLYQDVEGDETARTVWPVTLLDRTRSRLLAAHCELRGAFRHFRLDRIIGVHTGRSLVPVARSQLLAAWKRESGWRETDVLIG
jgi:predicted DNA-binding transcriptional regulator YafY